MSLRTRLLALNERVKRTAPGYMLLLAVGVGLLGGYGAVGFRYLIHFFQSRAWATDTFTVDWIASRPWYWVVGVPAAGGLIVGSISRWFAKETKGHGVPEVMEAVALKNGLIRPRVVVGKALASGLCIASGGSVGREGPIVQIGAAIGSTLGQILHVGPRRMRTLVGCGAAAGISATFNAPVAGALFAVEVILGDFAVPQFSPIVISSVAATVISHHYLGDLPAFEIPSYSLEHHGELIAYVILGVLAGGLAYTFIKSLNFAEDTLDKAPVPLPLRAAAGGAAVGGIALLFPGVLGVGYESMNVALMESPTAVFLAGLLVAKLLAVCLTLGSGGSGGIFAPSLFLGAMLGGIVGLVVEALAPDVGAPAGAYALVGMGAMVAATTHAPITAILILFELTTDYRIILPLMTSCIIATLVAAKLNKESIYTIKLMRRGVNVRAGQDINLLRNIPVREVLRDVVARSPHERLIPLVTHVSTSDAPCIYLAGDDRRLQGVVSLHELRPVLGDVDVLSSLVVASDVADTHFPFVSVDDDLDAVLTQLDVGYRDELPVLDGEILVGVVRLEDVLARYRHELKRREVIQGVFGE